MFRTILIGVDGSDHADAALRYGATLARALSSRVVIAAGVVQTPPLRGDGGAFDAIERQDAEERAERARAALEDVTDVRSIVVAGSTPANALHRAAEAEHADLIVVGTSKHHRIVGTQPGSVSEHLLHHSPCPVAVVPLFEHEPSFQHIGVAVDDGQPAQRALELALDLAGELDTEPTVELELLHVSPPDTVFLRPGAAAPAPRAGHTIPGWLEAMAGKARARARAEIVEETGDLSRRLVEMAADLDLMVIGSRDQGGIRRLILGSVSATMVRNAPCPVIVVPGRGARSSAPAAAATVERVG